MNSKILYLSIPNEPFTPTLGEGNPTQLPNFTYKLPVLSNDRIPNMKVELISVNMSAEKNTYREGFIIKLMNTSPNYISQDNQGIALGFMKSGVSEGGFEQYTLTAHTDAYGVMLSSSEREFKIELKSPDGTTPIPGNIKSASFIFRLTFPEPNEITDQYSRELSKVRL
tara:strand:- start:127 stop:633 length:507 start_codon:yes stop_codon:yes gene_type:complete